MSDPLPAITEAAATGEIADLFADIRTTVGVRVVNLVWRHLATMEGALPWAWAAVKPLYLDGLPDAAMAAFHRTMDIPKLASLAGEEPASVDAVLASYDHSNTINLFALGALRAWLNGEVDRTGTIAAGPRKAAPDLALPKLASEEDVSPETWALVLRLNKFGDEPTPLILASMYRHLAHAPAFLVKVEGALVPVAADGSLRRAVLDNRRTAAALAGDIARAISAGRPAHAVEIEKAVGLFVDHAIGKMVTICRAIRVARGTPL
ncbi:hypothetical protein [Reyranella sp.]|uniref:hypothetical protein n=1 Tax=Reyranella sp. TaxID=1929291 RepID=UPI003D145D55